MCTLGSGVERLLINGSRSFAPSRLSHRAERRSCCTLKIISAKLCSGFYTTSLNMCIFVHNLCLREGCRRCTMLLWVVTRSWSLCCWRPRRQWILKTIKVKNTHRSSQTTTHYVSTEQAQNTQGCPANKTIIKTQENKYIFEAFPNCVRSQQ